MRTIALIARSGTTGLTGELVVETELAWQVAVAGKVIVIQKADYIEKPQFDGFGSFADLFSR